MIFIDSAKQNISLTRGDYAALIFTAYNEDETIYELSPGDTVQLQIGKKYGTPDKTFVTKKTEDGATTDTDYTIEIQPEDTKDMKFGDYFYDVSVITKDGYTCTYIGDSGTNKPKFTILKEVGANE